MDPEVLPAGDGNEEYEIVLLDAAGAVLATRTLRPMFLRESFRDGTAAGEPLATTEPVDAQPFSVTLPADPAATRLAVRFGGNEVAAISRSPNPPQVTLLAPSGPGELARGPVTVRWSASDPDLPDAEGLTFNVLFTHDGGRTVVPAGVDLAGIDSYAVDAAELPGGPEARFIVEASDGWHRARAQSDPPFSLADAAPTPGIRHPADGAVLEPDVQVTISGFAYDLEDGFLVKDALRWFLDGAAEPIASGRDALVEFAPGEHTLRLAATDSAGQEAFVEVTFIAGLGPAAALFRRGDADASGTANITDAIFVLQFLFLDGREPPCRSAADVNDDSQVNISDPILLLNVLFVGVGTVPAPGYLECGPDPSADDLSCEGSTGCEN
jgi:hypothetical protein